MIAREIKLPPLSLQSYSPRTFSRYSSETIWKDSPGEIALLSCNEAIARGAIEAGVKVATSFPGSPLTYVIENLEISRHVRRMVNE